MKKLSFKNVFIRDLNGLYYRICRISNPRDHFGEYYIKILFPKFDHITLIAEERDKDFNPTSYEEFKTSVEEFTYHYNGGVAHYKTTLSGYMDQLHQLPTLKSSKGLDLLTYSIFSLLPMVPFEVSKIGLSDVVLKYPFNEMPRDFEMTLTNNPVVRITNIGKAKLLTTTTFPLDEKNVYITIVDYVRKEKNSNPDSFAQLYRAADPTRFLRP